YQLGATDFITKPFDEARIKTGAESHLSHLNTRSTPRKTFETGNQDPLTGLLTGRAIHSQIEKDVSFTSQHNLHLAALHVEIDAFKELFVSVGRKRAEVIIEMVAKAITDNTRKEDSVSRLGLSSFAVSLPASDPDTTLLTAHRISLTVAGFKAKFRGAQLPVSVSIGACITEQGAQSDAGRILEIASEAGRQATANGTGEVSSINLNADEEDNQPVQDEISVDHMLNQLKAGGKKDVVAQMDSILDKLTPLFEILNDEEREQLLVSLIESKNAQS
ncbi:MAG: diguanylate cyclase, partial [bacterium]